MKTCRKITTIIFDVDDTLYDVGTEFTAHRNIDGATSFMVEKLSFPDRQSARLLWDEYFIRYHSTAKALTNAEIDGRLPPPPDGWPPGKRLFNAADLAEWWTTTLDFSKLGGEHLDVVQMMESCPLRLVAFSNGPRKYVLRVLRELGLSTVFTKDNIFAVDDVLPSCKPEKEAFQKVLDTIGVKAFECVMVEDSMKNIHAAKAMGMMTVLVSGLGSMNKSKVDNIIKTSKPGDLPNREDPAVDICIESINELKSALPWLWNKILPT